MEDLLTVKEAAMIVGRNEHFIRECIYREQIRWPGLKETRFSWPKRI
jgi:hypothetical protein